MMNKVTEIQSEHLYKMLQKEEYYPQREEVTAAEPKEVWNYIKSLRQYFILGKQTSFSLKDPVNSIFLAPFLDERASNLDFPTIYDAKSQEFQGLHSYLSELICEIYSKEDTEILLKDLPNVISYFHEKIVGDDKLTKFSAQIKEISNTIRLFEDQVADPESFLKHCGVLEDRLMSSEKLIFGFSGAFLFQLLDLQLRERKSLNAQFLKRLNKNINGIRDILELQDDHNQSSKNHLDFADDLISFNKIQELSISAVSSKLSEERRRRLYSCLDTLKNTLDVYQEKAGVIFTSKNIAESWDLKKSMNNAKLEITPSFSFSKAREYYDQEIKAFVQTIAALRLAELEIDQHYDEELHHAYFEGFDASFLTDEDLKYFHTLVIIEDGRQIEAQPNDYESLLSQGALVNILAIHPMDDLQKEVKKGEESEPYLDLAMQAIFRRQTNIYQGSIDDPQWLNAALTKGLQTSNSVLWNIMLPSAGKKNTLREFIAVKTAIESRYFPRIICEPKSDYSFGIPISIENNLSFEQAMPVITREIKVHQDKQHFQLHLTPADFFAMDPESIRNLEIIPPQFAGDQLVSLDIYLTLAKEDLVGKIPYIWVVNDKDIIRQAAVPISWVNRCRNRIDSWNFIQALEGSSNQKTTLTLEKERLDWEEKKKLELEALKNQLTKAFEQSRLNDIQNAIYRILNGLIDGDISSVMDLAPAINATFVAEKPEIKALPKEATQNTAEEGKKEVETIEEVTISSEVWVETDECTSCSDCINALPTVFKYDANKQAIVHNAKGGTFAKIVAVAEKCPARCIHPGTPQNPNEQGLEKLIKRAEKFN